MDSAESAFDNYALSYDAEFTYSAVGSLQRKRVWKYLANNIFCSTHPELLEINCGTGVDAVWFQKNGFIVTATDVSIEMVGVTKEKLRETNSTVFQSTIQSVSQKLKDKKFDFIFSDFGGMNCLSPVELKEASLNLSKLLKPNGRLILVVMSRNCKWEQFYFKRKNDLDSAFRRRSLEGVEAEIFDQKFSTWYYSPEEMNKFFSEEFLQKKCKPIGIALPPSYLDNYFKKKQFKLKLLSMTEKILGNFTSLADKADHYLIDFIKK